MKMEKRVDGDTYQCPNVPLGADYFFAVSHSGAKDETVGKRDETIIRNDFVSVYDAAKQNPSGQTTLSSFTPYHGESTHDMGMTLGMEQGVIQDFHPIDMESLTADLMTFRDQQRSPIHFLVPIYSGRVNNVGGLVATFRWNGD